MANFPRAKRLKTLKMGLNTAQYEPLSAMALPSEKAYSDPIHDFV